MRARLNIFLPFIIILLGLLAYISSFNGVFVLDDNNWIVNNNEITSVGSYLNKSTRPLTALTVYLNYKLSGETPTDYHAVNLIIHLLAALLLYGVVRRTLILPFLNARYGRYSNVIAFFSAALWVVHPLQTESVTYIIQRAESLMGLFYLLTLYCFIRGVGSEKKKIWYFITVMACALGMVSKPIMVTAPILVLLYDVIFVSRSWRTAVRSHIAVYIGLILTWGILAFLVLMPNESSSSTGLSIDAITPVGYLATQQGIILHYLKLIVWPQVLCLDYAWPPAMTFSAVFVPAALISALVILAIIFVAKKYPAGYCLAWFFIILAPSSSIVPIADYAVEHRIYLSLAGLTALFSASVVMFVKMLAGRFRFRFNVTVVSSLFLMCIVAGLMGRTIVRNNDYSSALVITEKTVAVSPYNFRARTILINSYMDEYKFIEAEQAARAELVVIKEVLDAEGEQKHAVPAARAETYHSLANYQIGSALLCQGRNEDAVRFFMDALAIKKNFVGARYNLAVALHGLNRDEDALQEVLAVINIDPEFAGAYKLAGIIMVQAGKGYEAIPYLEKAIALDNSSIIAKLELAWLLSVISVDKGRDGKRALSLIMEVCEISGGGNYRALDVLAAAYAANGDFENALETAGNALELALLEVEKDPDKFSKDDSDNTSSPDNIKKRIGFYRAGKSWNLVIKKTRNR
jgi:tetratricopeptide (TPR) repeat protein